MVLAMRSPLKYFALVLFVGAVVNPCIALLSAVGGLRSPLGMVAGTARPAVLLPSGRFAACWPIGLGTYNGGPAIFLASERRILDPREEVLPIPISEDAVPLLTEAMQPRDISLTVLLRTCTTLFGRNGGMYDNMPWGWSGDDMSKREAFKRSQGKGMMGVGLGGDAKDQAYGSAYGLLADVVTDLCLADILSMFVEEEESISGGITLGASAYLRRRLNANGEGTGGDRSIVEVTTDEAVGVALALGRQVYVAEDVWEGARVRPEFVMFGNKMRLNLDIKGDEMFAERVVPRQQPPAWTIKSRGALLRMSVEEKRSTLRSSGVRPPRKRALSESEDKDRDLVNLILPLMDEAVRRDVLLARAWREGDFARAGELCEGKSERHIVAEQLQIAMKDNDHDLATILMERLEILESCRMDKTQDVGAYQKDLDADEWYLRDRRAAQGAKPRG